MTLREGGVYVTRSGRVVGPLHSVGKRVYDRPTFTDENRVYLWSENGKCIWAESEVEKWYLEIVRNDLE